MLQQTHPSVLARNFSMAWETSFIPGCHCRYPSDWVYLRGFVALLDEIEAQSRRDGLEEVTGAKRRMEWIHHILFDNRHLKGCGVLYKRVGYNKSPLYMTKNYGVVYGGWIDENIWNNLCDHAFCRVHVFLLAVLI